MELQTEPLEEHRWLARMLGEWDAEIDCAMVPGEPSQRTTGTERTRSLGGLWMISEGTGQMPGGGEAQSVMTLGYDPRTGRYVGSFIASMMTHLWIYDGRREGDSLILEAEGPGMDGQMALFRDILTPTPEGGRGMVSQCRLPDGSWQEFMTARYRRR